MLRRLQIDSCKAFDHQDVHLEPLSILVGRNGSGKTSVLQAIEFFNGLVSHSLAVQLGRHGWEYKDLPRLKAENLDQVTPRAQPGARQTCTRGQRTGSNRELRGVGVRP